MVKSTILVAGVAVLFCTSGLTGQTAQTIRNHLVVYGGLSLPTGEFASTSLSDMSAGLARPGLAEGLEFTSEVVPSFEVGVMVGVSVNSMDDTGMDAYFHSILPYATVNTGSWILIPFVGSAGFSIHTSPWLDLFGRGYAGVVIGNSPDMTVSGSGNSVHQISGTSLVAGYGAGVGVLISHQYSICVRYLTCEPEYSVAAWVNGYSASGKFKQQTSIVLLTLGYVVYWY